MKCGGVARGNRCSLSEGGMYQFCRCNPRWAKLGSFQDLIVCPAGNDTFGVPEIEGCIIKPCYDSGYGRELMTTWVPITVLPKGLC